MTVYTVRPLFFIQNFSELKSVTSILDGFHDLRRTWGSVVKNVSPKLKIIHSQTARLLTGHAFSFTKFLDIFECCSVLSPQTLVLKGCDKYWD